MRLLCPICRESLTPVGAALRCSNGSLMCRNEHHFTFYEGVLPLLEEQFGRRLETFLAAYIQVRTAEHKRIFDTGAYETLPYGPLAAGNPEWRIRQYDLAFIQGLLANQSRTVQSEKLRILEIGAWNGWLTHWLVGMGHHVTAVDYFNDTYDGLGARKFYAGGNMPASQNPGATLDDWLAIQMDMADLSIIDQQFDTVILNHCVQFCTDPVTYVRDIISGTSTGKVAPGGLLLLIGLEFHRDTALKARQVASFRKYLAQFGLDFLHPTKAYLDFEDMAGLQAAGIRLGSFPRLWPANLKSLVNPTLPRHCYGIFYENGKSELRSGR
ncbi:MAG: methyltransferase domain-containing protein [Chloroflexi bacterium]|nr:methyltransferase domain-containing protein [Chloroflexota bacterium]